jgi:3-oxoadipate enol-lactonase
LHDVTLRGDDGCALFASALGHGPAVVLLHGGGPDRWSLLPLARMLAHEFTVVLPDIRGYGQSVCLEPARHTWGQYTDDLRALLDHLGLLRAVVGGTGLGSTIALRAAVAYPERVAAVVPVGVEDIEDDDAKAAETEFLEAFAERARTAGIQAAWDPILPTLPPVVGAMVRDAIPRSTTDSIVAAAAIGRDRCFREVTDLAAVRAPTLVIPGTDWRHPRRLAERAAEVIPDAVLADVRISADLHTPEDLAEVVGPAVLTFLTSLHLNSG